MTGPTPYFAPPPDWMRDTPCQQTDPDMWHPEPKDSATARRAKAICRTCPVRAECLTHALATNEQEGIWGGLVLKERRKLKKLRESA